MFGALIAQTSEPRGTSVTWYQRRANPVWYDTMDVSTTYEKLIANNRRRTILAIEFVTGLFVEQKS